VASADQQDDPPSLKQRRGSGITDNGTAPGVREDQKSENRYQVSQVS